MNYKDKQEFLLQEVRRNELQQQSVTSIWELNQKILKLTDDYQKLVERVKTLEATNV